MFFWIGCADGRPESPAADTATVDKSHEVMLKAMVEQALAREKALKEQIKKIADELEQLRLLNAKYQKQYEHTQMMLKLRQRTIDMVCALQSEYLLYVVVNRNVFCCCSLSRVSPRTRQPSKRLSDTRKKSNSFRSA